MRHRTDIEAMVRRARVEEMKATDRALLYGADLTAAREFAGGVEAGLLWALGSIGEIPFHPWTDADTFATETSPPERC